MRNRSLTAVLALGLTPCLTPPAARAGWLSAEQESFTGDDVKAVAKQGGNFKKNWRHFQELAAQTRENERRIEQLRRQPAPAERRGTPGGRSLEELAASAGPRLDMGAPGVGPAAPLLSAPRANMDREDAALWNNISAYVNTKVRTPEIRGWIAEYMWNAARYTGRNEVLRDHVNYIREGLAARGQGLPTVEIGPMPDANTYGLYTSGIRQIVLREGMPKELFIAVEDHEQLHALDDRHDQPDRGGSEIGFSWHRDHSDNIFAARGSTQAASAQPGQAEPAGQRDAQQVSEFAETLAWRGMACAAGVAPIIRDVQRCN